MRPLVSAHSTQPSSSSPLVPQPVLAQAAASAPIVTGVNGTRILAWNNLGMHCMDSSYAEFSILPPYNTIEAQLIVNGRLVTSGAGYTLTYEAVADATGSINRTSIGKGNWFMYAQSLYGKPIGSADEGLNAWNMPGPLNQPQRMLFESFNIPAPGASTLVNWFRAEGIPITPVDDLGNRNAYPMMRIVARNAANAVIAESDIVLPVSDEMDCRSCHGANTSNAARPTNGWIVDANKDREFRLNVLKLHDDRETTLHPSLYAEALAAKGMPSGLYGSALMNKPVLCASCHASEALGAPSFTSSNGNGTVPPLTMSVHGRHSTAVDPKTGLTLDNTSNRAACYSCHPGATTRCLRGAMGSAVAADGTLAIQCQNCHGSMSQVGASTRVGWFMEPTCQSCHTGTATSNNGQIRYTSVFDSPGHERVAVNSTFATTKDTPAPGLSLYRFSSGHGGLQCTACHGSTHAIFPSSHDNDNVRNIQLQGHEGTMTECTSCHATVPSASLGGPHGMHAVGQSWVSDHHDVVSQVGRAACQACHGSDYRGTVLSRVQGSRSFRVGDSGAQVAFYRGGTVGCYSCHQGPSSSSLNTAAAPITGDVSGQTVAGVPVAMTLPGASASVVMRVLKQPANGTVGIQNGVATYYPFDGFVGTDTFTFAGYNGSKNTVTGAGAVPAVGTVTVIEGKPVITASPGDQSVFYGSGASFSVAASGAPTLQYQWYHGATAITGATSATLSLGAVTYADAGAYSVVVSNAYGSVTSGPASLTVKTPQPIVSAASPTSGPLGQLVSVSGVYLTTTKAVTVGGVAASFTVSSDVKITLTIPAAAVSGPIVVTTAGGTATGPMFTVTKSLPTIASFTPASGGVGTAVTVTGSNLTGASALRFNGTPARFTVLSATSIVTGVPSGATSGVLSVVTPDGTATSSTAFSVAKRAVAPTIASISPISGRVGSQVTITGTNLGGATTVTIGSVAASFVVKSAGSLVLTVPTGAVTGRVAVTTAGGTATGPRFTVTP